jgi:hypothetical protein
MVWTGSIWLRIGTSGRLLWTRYWNFGFRKMLGSSWGAAKPGTSQEGLSSMELVSFVRDSAITNMTVVWNILYIIGYISNISYLLIYLLTYLRRWPFLRSCQLCSHSSSPFVLHALPSHPLWLDHSNYVWRGVQVMKLLIMQFSPSPANIH